MKNKPLEELSQEQWDALILSIIKPYFSICYARRTLSIDDLKQEAWIGLLNACKNYNPEKGKFVTYAYFYIKGMVVRFINKQTQIKFADTEDDLISLCGEYEDSSAERKDLMDIVTKKVSDQKHQDLLEEYFVNQKTCRQIAKERGVSHQLINNRIKKLLNVLERRLINENA